MHNESGSIYLVCSYGRLSVTLCLQLRYSHSYLDKVMRQPYQAHQEVHQSSSRITRKIITLSLTSPTNLNTPNITAYFFMYHGKPWSKGLTPMLLHLSRQASPLLCSTSLGFAQTMLGLNSIIWNISGSILRLSKYQSHFRNIRPSVPAEHILL